MLRRPINTIELIQLNKMFCANRGYKDLIRDFKKEFNVDLPKDKAKKFLANRSWQEVLLWLTGDIVNTKDLDKIPQYKEEYYELLEQMIRLNAIDEQERLKDISDFVAHDYYIPEECKYFNLPLYGEIITYKFKDPMLKCFLFDNDTHRISKIEDVYISDKIPTFLLSIIRKINNSVIGTKLDTNDIIKDSARFMYLKSLDECAKKGLKNIFDSDLFKKYNIQMKQ